MKIGDSKKVNTAEKQKVSEKIQMMQQKSTEENRQKRSKSKMELRNSA